jgi:hypothetical protein
MGLVRPLNRTPSRSVSRSVRSTAWVWGSAVAVAALLFVACGDGGTGSADRAAPPASTSTSTSPPEDAELTAADFTNVHAMKPVGEHHFIANVNGHLDEALAVARASDGGEYPVGTILQLVPQEAMVKRRAGFNAGTNDWEFFSLDVSRDGTKIMTRGGAEVVNRFGGNCASCHAKADARFDMVCMTDHGCDPLPIGVDLIKAIQASDPRPQP